MCCYPRSTPGHTQLHLRWRHRSLRIPVTFVFDPRTATRRDPRFSPPPHPSGPPGLPRLVHFHRRVPGRRIQLPAEIDDCAALLRFAYREALRAHDEAGLAAILRKPLSLRSGSTRILKPRWAQTSSASAPAHSYPEDIDNGSFAQFADARTLMERNTYLIGRDLRLARPGDLIFYRQLDQNSPYDVPGAHPLPLPISLHDFLWGNGCRLSHRAHSTTAKARCGACW